MYYDLVPMKTKYRGMGRILTVCDLRNLKKADFQKLLEEYFEYLDYIEEQNKNSFEKMVAFYKKLRGYDINCEIIAYGNEKIQKIFGYKIELLGIDLLHNMCESLFDGEINPQIINFLNENGLCNTSEDALKCIPHQDHGDVDWKPCYVYKVFVEDKTKN